MVPLSSLHRRILTAIQLYQQEHGITPTYDQLAALLRTSRSTAWRAVRWLARHHVLEITSSRGCRLAVAIAKEYLHETTPTPARQASTI